MQTRCLSDSHTRTSERPKQDAALTFCSFDDLSQLLFREVPGSPGIGVPQVQIPSQPNLLPENQLHHSDDVEDRLAAQFVRFYNVALRRSIFAFGFPSLSGRTKCSRACYDCLLSYSNQTFHPLIDRHLIREYLLALKMSKTTKNTERTPADVRRKKEAYEKVRQRARLVARLGSCEPLDSGVLHPPHQVRRSGGCLPMTSSWLSFVENMLMPLWKG